MKNLSLILLVFICIKLEAQDCIFYDEEFYNGSSWELNIGEQVVVHFDQGEEPSWEFPNPNAAITMFEVNPPHNYPIMGLYSDIMSPYVAGTSNYNDAGDVVVKCKQKCLTIDCLPKPTAWIPFDGIDTPFNNSNPPITPQSSGRILVLRKAYIMENAEDLGWPHGPAGSIDIVTYGPELYEDFNDDFTNLNENIFCYAGWEDNDCPRDCESFTNQYPRLESIKLPGFIYAANYPLAPNPKNEWLDGPWGMCYSNFVVHNWDSEENKTIMVREGDVSSCDDFMGMIPVNKNTEGLILFKLWHGGYVVLENIDAADWPEEKIDQTNFFWMNSWDGEYFHGDQDTPDGQPYSQYEPLSTSTIPEMEATFPENTNVGLLGGSFNVIGTLSKPMLYTAPCQPAFFNE